MTLNSFLKVNIETKFTVTRDDANGYETWQINYTRRDCDLHYDRLHQIDSIAKLPKDVLKAKVKFVSVNKIYGKLEITVE